MIWLGKAATLVDDLACDEVVVRPLLCFSGHSVPLAQSTPTAVFQNRTCTLHGSCEGGYEHNVFKEQLDGGDAGYLFLFTFFEVFP